MLSREIPREEWTRFFDQFSKQHQGWIVRVEVLGLDLGDQEEAARLPLVGISAEAKPVEKSVEIIVGNKPEDRATRIIQNPARIWFKRPEEPGDEAVEVEDTDGRKTLVTFARIPPEQTDRQLPGA
ncbi:MAG TPA: DUF5335 family protein [Candidatus Binatia bacterium]